MEHEPHKILSILYCFASEDYDYCINRDKAFEGIVLGIRTNTIIAEAHTIELSHEALITAWERLTNWLQEAHEDLLLQDTIRKGATEWMKHNESIDHVYRGEQLAEALLWRTRNILNRNEDKFIEASIMQQQKEKQGITRRNVIISAIVAVVGLGRLGGTFYLSPLLTTPNQPITLPLTYTGHTASVSSVAWAPDGQRIASAGADGTVQVWTASLGTLLHTYTGHTASVSSVTWAPDGQRIASVGDDGDVQVWTASSGTLLHTHTNSMASVAWAPDDQRIASASGYGDVQVWTASSGTLLHTYTGHTAFVWSVVWAPDGQRIASASDDGEVQIWTASSGSLLHTYIGHTASVWSVAWAPDGQRIASAGEDGEVQVWTASSGTLLHTHTEHTAFVWSIAWAPDGQRIASASEDGTVQVWTTN